MVIFRSVTHVREKRRNSVRVYMGWHQRWRMRQPALLSMLRSSAHGLLRPLSAIKARNSRLISTHVHENSPNLFVLNLRERYTCLHQLIHVNAVLHKYELV